MGDKFCVYRERVAERLSQMSGETYDSIQEALRKYPDVSYRAMLSMLAHRSATVAANAALGYPLDRAYVEETPTSDTPLTDPFRDVAIGNETPLDDFHARYTALLVSHEALEARIGKYQQVCAAAYQLAGMVGAPLRFLDALGDAANGEIGERTDPDKLLPVDLTECDALTPGALILPVAVHRVGDTAIGIQDATGKVYGSLHDIVVALNKTLK